MKLFRILPLVFGSAAVASVFASMSSPARAVTLNVNGTNYDITTIRDTGSNLSSQLQSTPWWGTGASNTINFVNALGSALGYPNTGGAGTVRTPYFAYQFQSTFFDTLFQTQGFGLGGVVQSPTTVATYAVLTPAPPTGVPEPTTIFSTIPAGLVMLLLRKYKKRTASV